MCRNLEDGETELKGNEKFLLDLICKAYYLPKWCSINDYKAIFRAEGLQVRRHPLKSPAACVSVDSMCAVDCRCEGQKSVHTSAPIHASSFIPTT